MPLRLIVGFPPRAWWQERSSEPSDLGEAVALLASFEKPAPLRFEMDLLSIWGTSELERQAASFALDGHLLPPHPFDEIADIDLHVRYIDRVEECGERLPFLHLLYAGWSGIYLPVPEGDLPLSTDLDRAELGSSFELGREMERLTEVLGVDLREPGLLSRLQAEMEAEDPATSHAVERFLCASVWESCRAAQRVKAPLYLDRYYRLKPSGLRFGDRASSYWGLDRISRAVLDDDGATLVVELAGGYRYRLPIPCALSFIRELSPGPLTVAGEVAVSASGMDVELTLGEGNVVDLSAISILCGCEPDYVHFGGSSEESAANVRRGYKDYGPFRIVPLSTP